MKKCHKFALLLGIVSAVVAIATAVTADASTLYTQDAKKQIFQRIFSTNCPHPERTIGKKQERAKKNNILKLFERG